MKGFKWTLKDLSATSLLVSLLVLSALCSVIISTKTNALSDLPTATLDKWEGVLVNHYNYMTSYGFPSNRQWVSRIQTAAPGNSPWTGQNCSQYSAVVTFYFGAEQAPLDIYDKGDGWAWVKSNSGGQLHNIASYFCDGQMHNSGASYNTNQAAPDGSGAPLVPLDNGTSPYPFYINGYDTTPNAVVWHGYNPPTGGGGNPPVPELNDDISLYYKKEGKKLTLVHKTPIPPLDLTTMTCRYQVTRMNQEKLMDKITPCNEDNFQQVEVENYEMLQVNLDILYDKDYDGTIHAEESIGTIQRNIDVDGRSEEGMIGHEWIAPQSDYKDCSTYGANVAGAIGCHFHNFGITIRDFFIPKADAVALEFEDLNDYLNVKLGFIYQAISMPVELLGSTIVALGTPNCNLNYGTLSGQNVSLSLCNVRSMVGHQPFDLALNLFRGAIAIGFVFASARYANRFLSNKEGAEI